MEILIFFLRASQRKTQSIQIRKSLFSFSLSRAAFAFQARLLQERERAHHKPRVCLSLSREQKRERDRAEMVAKSGAAAFAGGRIKKTQSAAPDASRERSSSDHRPSTPFKKSAGESGGGNQRNNKSSSKTSLLQATNSPSRCSLMPSCCSRSRPSVRSLTSSHSIGPRPTR